jgi:hypothetical protein
LDIPELEEEDREANILEMSGFDGINEIDFDEAHPTVA